MSDTNQKIRPAAKSSRRRAREFAVQGIYQWLLTHESVAAIERFLKDSTTAFVRADEELFRTILIGAIKGVDALNVALRPHVDRELTEVSPVELAILYVGAYEIIQMPQTPYPVIINESIELAKTFGGTDGHKFVNGVLDKLAAVAREAEIADVRARRQR